MASDFTSHDSSCSDNSDNEVFLGRITLEEIKRRFSDRRTIACPYTHIQNNAKNEVSMRIIETNSEPNLLANVYCKTETKVIGRTDSNNDWENSSEFCKSPNATFSENAINEMQNLSKLRNEELNSESLCNEDRDITNWNCESAIKSNCVLFSDLSLQENNSPFNVQTPQSLVSCQQQSPSYETPSNVMDTDISIDEERHFKTPADEKMEAKIEKGPLQTLKYPVQRNLFNTNCVSPSTNSTSVSPLAQQNKDSVRSVFKTPTALPINKTNPGNSIKRTPKKWNNFEHIASPIAAYIKNSPQVPLLKDVKPKKQLVVVSGIPKLKGSLNPLKQNNKENVNLPEVAYRSAKKTKVIDNQDEPRMPQSVRVKKLLSSLPKPVVIKHDHRENITNTKPLPRPEDSFVNLSLHQADLSVCIKKSAMSPTPHKQRK